MRPLRSILPSLVALIWLTLLALPLPAQAPAVPAISQAVGPAIGSKVWVGRHQEIENFLLTAEITREESVPIGVTKPTRCYLTPGGPVESILWKPLPPGRHRGFWDSYKAEIAAYEMDKLLGLDMVPVTIERRYDGDLGAAMMWVDDVKMWRIDEPIRGPDPVAWDRQVIRMKMFDNLIGNTDRNQGNLLVDPAYNLILIDHSRAFTAGKRLMVDMTRVDRTFWDQIQALTLETLYERLDKWISKGAIRDILERREKMEEAIAKLVAHRGDAAFLR